MIDVGPLAVGHEVAEELEGEHREEREDFRLGGRDRNDVDAPLCRVLGELVVADGADGAVIHQGICDRFEKAGYKTGLVNGRMQGYFHGTGHGVGSYLGVHEGPQRISKLPNFVALQPGMIVSNEPGYYKDGEYGIRIENLEVVMPAEDVAGGDRPMHRFEALTLAPIDRRLIDKSLLTPEEIAQFDAYHARVVAEIGPRVEGEVRAWLEEVCAPL